MALERLGVLAVYLNNARLEELGFFRRLCLEGERLGLKVEVFTPTDVEEGRIVRTLTYDAARGKWVRQRTTFPPLIYDRCRYHGVATYRVLKAFRSKYTRLRYLGRPLANKWTMHQVLTEDESIRRYIPETFRYTGTNELMRFLKKHKLIYLKPKNGTGGRGILRIEQISRNLFLLQGRNQQRTILAPVRASEKQLAIRLNAMQLSSDYVVQQGIPLTLKDGRVHDYRLLIQKNGEGEWEVTGCAGRIGPRKSITSNLHGGGSAVSLDKMLAYRFSEADKIERIKDDMYSFAYELATYLEGRFGRQCELGLDIAVDPKGGIWLLEVNPKPSREIFRRIGESVTYRRAVTRPLEYAVWLLKQRKSRRSESSASGSRSGGSSSGTAGD